MCIVQALYHKPVALAELNATFFSNGITLLNDLLVKLGIGREGDGFRLQSRIYNDLFSLLDLICM